MTERQWFIADDFPQTIFFHFSVTFMVHHDIFVDKKCN